MQDGNLLDLHDSDFYFIFFCYLNYCKWRTYSALSIRWKAAFWPHGRPEHHDLAEWRLMKVFGVVFFLILGKTNPKNN